jgi:uncharacterized protein with FMN-binding domain
MKKFLLSVVVIMLFSIYVIHKRFAAPSDTTTKTVQISPTIVQVTGGNRYKDGIYIGSVADAFYGNIRIKATIQEGKITDIQFLSYPQDRNTSIEINTQAMPLLKTEAIKSQNATVDVVSGATQTSEAFKQSLQSALAQAKE